MNFILFLSFFTTRLSLGSQDRLTNDKYSFANIDIQDPLNVDIGYIGMDFQFHNLHISTKDSDNINVTNDTLLRYQYNNDSITITTIKFEFDTTMEYGSRMEMIFYSNIDLNYFEFYSNKLLQLKSEYLTDFMSSIKYKKRRVDFQIIDSFLIEGFYKDLLCIRNSNIFYKGGGSSDVSKGFITMRICDYSYLQKSLATSLSEFKKQGLGVDVLHKYINSPSPNFYSYESTKFRILYSSDGINLIGYKTLIYDWQLETIFVENLESPLIINNEDKGLYIPFSETIYNVQSNRLAIIYDKTPVNLISIPMISKVLYITYD